MPVHHAERDIVSSSAAVAVEAREDCLRHRHWQRRLLASCVITAVVVRVVHREGLHVRQEWNVVHVYVVRPRTVIVLGGLCIQPVLRGVACACMVAPLCHKRACPSRGRFQVASI